MNLVIMPVVCGPRMTRACIDSVLAQDIPLTIWVIGNGPADNVIPYIRSVYWNDPRVIITSYEPMCSLNHVWNQALSCMDSHALVINNDVVLRPDTYRLLLEDGGQFVTGVSVNTREQMTTTSSSRSPHPCFSCFLIRRSCWDRVGPFDESFWAYASDGDYHLRMDALGIDAYALDIPFYHETSSTLKLVSNALRDDLQKKADADRETFKRKWGFAIGSDEYYKKFRKQRDNRYVKEGVL